MRRPVCSAALQRRRAGAAADRVAAREANGDVGVLADATLGARGEGTARRGAAEKRGREEGVAERGARHECQSAREQIDHGADVAGEGEGARRRVEERGEEEKDAEEAVEACRRDGRARAGGVVEGARLVPYLQSIELSVGSVPCAAW